MKLSKSVFFIFLLAFFVGHSSSFATAEDETLNEHAFGSLRRSCTNILNSILAPNLNGFSSEQKVLIQSNLLSKTDLRIAKSLNRRNKAFRELYIPRVNGALLPAGGRFYRGLQISPEDLQRILKNGMDYLDWRRPSEGLYVTNSLDLAYGHAMLPDHGVYSSNFLGVILTIEPNKGDHGWAGEKLRVRGILPEWITKVQIVNRQFLLGTDEKLLFDLLTKEP